MSSRLVVLVTLLVLAGFGYAQQRGPVCRNQTYALLPLVGLVHTAVYRTQMYQ
jgi:hypothetical protein